MATYIVKADGSGDYTTIAAGFGAASHGDTVEIQDSSTYTESGITISANNISLIATGTNEPVWDGNQGGHGIEMYGSGTYFQGIEFTNFAQYALKDGDADGRAVALSGCHFHGIGIRPIRRVAGKAGALVGTYSGSTEYALIDQCKFIHSGSSQTFFIYGSYVKLRNSLFTGAKDEVLYSDSSYTNTTASFCTVISDDAGVDVQYWIINEFAKVINCVVSSSDVMAKGIAAADHTYNTVNIPGTDATYGHHPWGNAAGTSDDSAGTGETTGLVYFTDPDQLDYTLAQTGSAVSAASTLAAFYNMDTGTGTTLYDRSDLDEEHDATLQSGVTWDTSIFGSNMRPAKYSLGFDGASANSRVDLPAGIIDDYPISVSYWFKTADVTRIGIHFYIHIGSGKWSTVGHWSDGILYTGVSARIVRPQWFVNNEWTHVVLTQTSTSAARVYINGIDRTDETTSDPWTQVGTLTQLGTRNSTANRCYSGSMEDVSIWNVELTHKQAAALYNRGRPDRDLAAGLPATTLCNCAIGTATPYTGFVNPAGDGEINRRADDLFDQTGSTRTLFSGLDRGAYYSDYMNQINGTKLSSSSDCLSYAKVMGVIDTSGSIRCPRVIKVMGTVKQCVIE